MASRAQPSMWRQTVKAGAVRSGALFGAVALLVATALIALALVSYHSGDPSFDTAAGGPAKNWLGAPGAYVADLMLMIAGWASALVLPLGLIWGTRLWRDRPAGDWRRMLRGAAIGIVLIATAVAFVSDAAVMSLPAGWGGLIGLAITSALDWLIGLIGDPTIVGWTELGVGAAIGLTGLVVYVRSLDLSLSEREWFSRPTRLTDQREPKVEDDDDLAILKRSAPPRAIALPETRPAPVIAERNVAPSVAKPKERQASLDLRDDYQLPPLDLLTAAPPSPNAAIDKASLERNARLLENVLDDFKVKGAIVEVRPGPVVTMYELEPESGVKASRVIALADDIARNMSAISARVATIPGRSVIGIELPNARREGVNLHELVASQSFEDQSAQLPIILGKNIAGDPVIADLAPMPHLLIAGTTGSGKSVGLNCMILSLLYRLTPKQCKMIMIDPKMLELSMYEDIPHLLAPVVTEPAKAVRALKWAVEQMEDRYRMMASVGVRSLAGFNDKVSAARAKGKPLGRKVQTGYHP
jgi:S-DNA-T family DNA segregation ATPase FtsK/SpoIIIE